MKNNREKLSLFGLMNSYPTEDSAREQFVEWRWGDGVRCPHCDGLRISVSEWKMPFRCKDCRKRFSVRTGTVMESSNLPFRTWLVALYLLTTNIKGVASTRLASDVAITQKSAWFLAQRLRKAFANNDKLAPFYAAVEVDETYFGGKERNKHASDKQNAGRGAVGKTAVVGIKQRGSKDIRAKVVHSTDAKTLLPLIGQNVGLGASVYTDGHKSYKLLGAMGYDHEVVEHSVGEYVRGRAHTNGIESFWSLLKRGYIGTHHHFSAKHLQRYVDEFATRHRIRKADDTINVMRKIAQAMGGVTLPYAKLIA